MKNKSNPRRKFIKNIAMGVGAATGAGLLSSMKNNNSENKEKIKLLASNGELVEVEKEDVKKPPKTKTEIKEATSELQKRGREGLKGKKFVMVIDLAKCKNERVCMSACDNAHQLKSNEQHHINIQVMKDAEDTAPYYMPKPCMQCDNPPCTKVCPVDATFKRQDGIVLIDNERCIGCRFCIAACPYSVRIFNWTDPKDAEKYKDKPYDIELNVPQKKGTISKCIFSADRLRNGKLPYCVSACPNEVYWFGDKNENAVTNGTTGETVRFNKLLEDNAGYTILEELGTKPQVFYLPPKNRTKNVVKEDLPNKKH